MKILSTEQIRKADEYTILNEPVSSLDLMERAAHHCFNMINSDYHFDRFSVFCGVGNNGGDGLVIARLLAQRGKFTEVYIVHYSENQSADFKTNLVRLQGLENIRIRNLTESNSKFTIRSGNVVIDALIGSGLSRPINGFTAEIIAQINQEAEQIIAIDTPSGLFNDHASLKEEKEISIIQAQRTFTFEYPKLSHCIPENGKYVGKWSLVDVGLSRKFYNSALTKYYYVTDEMIHSIRVIRNDFDHKGIFGHGLIVAGKEGSMGAAVLATRACMKSGVGLTTALIPANGIHILQISIPEVMCLESKNEGYIGAVKNGLKDLQKYHSIGIGPGIGKETEAKDGLRWCLQSTDKPVVIDADALNIISENPELWDLIPAESILTPHLKEFERLTKKVTNHFERLEILRTYCAKHNVIVVLKGQHTAIGIPNGDVFFNSTGNSGMATAGSGDVLTGIITGLLAQGYRSKDAAILGVYIHGLAGDFALEMGESKESLNASDIIDKIGAAFNNI